MEALRTGDPGGRPVRGERRRRARRTGLRERGRRRPGYRPYRVFRGTGYGGFTRPGPHLGDFGRAGPPGREPGNAKSPGCPGRGSFISRSGVRKFAAGSWRGRAGRAGYGGTQRVPRRRRGRRSTGCRSRPGAHCRVRLAVAVRPVGGGVCGQLRRGLPSYGDSVRCWAYVGSWAALSRMSDHRAVVRPVVLPQVRVVRVVHVVRAVRGGAGGSGGAVEPRGAGLGWLARPEGLALSGCACWAVPVWPCWSGRVPWAVGPERSGPGCRGRAVGPWVGVTGLACRACRWSEAASALERDRPVVLAGEGDAREVRFLQEGFRRGVRALDVGRDARGDVGRGCLGLVVGRRAVAAAR